MSVNKKKIVVAISGGVDSSVTAMLLKKQGYEIIGMFMKLGVNQEVNEAAARRVCQKLGIKFYPINFIYQFKKEVIDYFLDSYACGLTPNPCVKCNQFIKFDSLMQYAKRVGADYLATGHYVKKLKTQSAKLKTIYKLYRGRDKKKDQSYFLYNLMQEQLAHILFPLGNFTKDQVKKIADKAKLPYLIKESQDICFLSGDHNDFLRKYLKLKPGSIKTLDGKIVGEHQGLPLYTIGQRRGVEIGGIGPFYVAKCDYKTNVLYVVSDRDDPALYSNRLIAKDVNWISVTEPSMPLKCEAVIRYRHQPVKCIITKKSTDNYLVKFKEPQRAITPGQSIVFYQIKRVAIPPRRDAHENNENEILGGGIISQ